MKYGQNELKKTLQIVGLHIIGYNKFQMNTFCSGNCLQMAVGLEIQTGMGRFKL